MRIKILCAGMALVLGGCTSISVTSNHPDEILICDGTWEQNSMFGHTSANHSIVIYPNPVATKIKIKTFNHVEGVCFARENATCKVSHKGKTLYVTSTFPQLTGTQTFIFDPRTAYVSFGVGGLDGGEEFSGTCQRKTD